jgi:hypothetical protein
MGKACPPTTPPLLGPGLFLIFENSRLWEAIMAGVIVADQ